MARVGRKRRKRFSVLTKFVATKTGSRIVVVTPGLKRR